LSHHWYYKNWCHNDHRASIKGFQEVLEHISLRKEGPELCDDNMSSFLDCRAQLTLQTPAVVIPIQSCAMIPCAKVSCSTARISVHVHTLAA
jgi:hypothetical protein